MRDFEKSTGEFDKYLICFLSNFDYIKIVTILIQFESFGRACGSLTQKVNALVEG